MVYGGVLDSKEVERVYREVSWVKIYFDFCSVSKDIYELGLIEVKTKFGNKVKAYDLERSICDVIKFRKRLDLDTVKYSIKKYLKSNKRNMKKLLEYAEKLGCKEEVIDIVSLLYDGKLKDLEVYYE